MAIRNSDGTPYQLGSISQFDSNDPTFDLFNLWDAEAIRQGGSPIYYYEIVITPQMVNKTYMEARSKLFCPKHVELYCNYEPIGSQYQQSAFGIDSGTDEMIFEFNYKDMLERIGHPPKEGSRLYTPHLGENWQIIQCNLAEFKMWGAMRMNVVAQKYQESLTTGEGQVTQKKPESTFKINF